MPPRSPRRPEVPHELHSCRHCCRFHPSGADLSARQIAHGGHQQAVKKDKEVILTINK